MNLKTNNLKKNRKEKKLFTNIYNAYTKPDYMLRGAPLIEGMCTSIKELIFPRCPIRILYPLRNIN